MVEALGDELDLAEDLRGQGREIVVAGEVGDGFEWDGAGGDDDGIDLADRVEQPLDRRGITRVDSWVRRP
ncbi:Uncharacterised protein [Mycobacteroides abscessus subsp. abscessus]|nr:Uncharacterised protein [Mycobacteroides abscessus subsp. abscessus]